MNRVISCIAGRGCLLLPICFLDKTLLAFALLHFVLQGQTCLLLQVSLDFLHWNSNPLWWKGHLFMLVLEGLVVLHRTIPIQLLCDSGWDMDLDYCDVGWFALERNQDLSFVFEIASKCCISAAFVDYEGYPISSKGFLPTVVDIMVMWIKLPFTIQFSSLIPKVSVFPLPSAWPHSIYLDSRASHSGSLCNIVLYSPGVYFHIQTQPQQEGYPLWPSLFILSGTISLLFSVAYWTYRSGEFI